MSLSLTDARFPLSVSELNLFAIAMQVFVLRAQRVGRGYSYDIECRGNADARREPRWLRHALSSEDIEIHTMHNANSRYESTDAMIVWFHCRPLTVHPHYWIIDDIIVRTSVLYHLWFNKQIPNFSSRVFHEVWSSHELAQWQIFLASEQIHYFPIKIFAYSYSKVYVQCHTIQLHWLVGYLVII